MAVERTGTVYTQRTNAATGSIALNIPAAGDVVIVTCSGEPNEHFSDGLSFVDESVKRFDLIERSTGWTTHNGSAWILTKGSGHWPGDGAQTLYFKHSGTASEGRNMIVAFYSNVDIDDPIISTDTTLAPVNSWTATLSDVGPDDMSLITGYTYTNNSAIFFDADLNGQTIVAELERYNNNASGLAEKLGSSAMSMETAGTATEWSLPLAFALRAAAFLPIFRKQIHNLVRF